MIALYKNILEGATVTASSESVLAPLSNLDDDKLVKYTRLPAGEQYIQFDLGSAKSFDAIACAGWNFSTLTLRASNSATFASGVTTLSVPKVFDHPDTASVISSLWFDAVTARYIRIVTSGSSVKDFGKIMLGTMAEFPAMDAKQKMSYATTKKPTRAKGGCLFKGASGYKAREQEISFPEFGDDGVELFADLWNTVGNYRPFFSVVWDDKQDIFPMLYGALDQERIDFDRTEYKAKPFSTKIKLEECF